jgi:hypothetical protein
MSSCAECADIMFMGFVMGIHMLLLLMDIGDSLQA